MNKLINTWWDMNEKIFNQNNALLFLGWMFLHICFVSITIPIFAWVVTQFPVMFGAIGIYTVYRLAKWVWGEYQKLKQDD